MPTLLELVQCELLLKEQLERVTKPKQKQRVEKWICYVQYKIQEGQYQREETSIERVLLSSNK